MSASKKGLLQRLDEGVVIGDGGFVFALEKRGYVKAGPWTPEATCEYPEAVKGLHREFLRAGADVMQTFTFYASEDKLENRGNESLKKHSGADVNDAACKIAREVADEGEALVAGGTSQTPAYLSGKSKAEVQEFVKKQLQVFIKNKVDFMICEYYEHVEEAVWHVEACKEAMKGIPVVASLCIGPQGDVHGVSPGTCAVQLANAGADVIGINCHFDPFVCLETVRLMKKGLEDAKIKRHLIIQPLGFWTPDAGTQGFIDLPEFPFGLEPRIFTRFEMQKYAREAYEMGIRYIGGCCGFEAYHVRAIAEEMAKERGKLPAATEKHDLWGAGLKQHTKPWVRARARRDYWENLKPSTGRPYSASLSKPNDWGVTRGDELLKQKAENTTKEELEELFAKKL